MHSSPVIGTDGTVYAGCDQDGTVFALDGATGAKRWWFDTASSGWIDSSPAIGSDGTAYVGSGNYKVYAIQ